MPKPICSCKMVNVIGDDFFNKDEFKKKFKFYDYFKKRNQKIQGKWAITLLKFNTIF